ncbi:MAG: vanadium-dependent haloperoxidase [Bacteroidota bacterium]
MENLAQRKKNSLDIRIAAAQLAHDQNDPIREHLANGDESLPKRMMSFTKGLPHDSHSGLLKDEADFEKFVKGICKGDPEVIKETPLGPPGNKWLSKKGKVISKVRAWESAGAGLTFDLEGPDAQAVTMKPAPALGSDELIAEMAEVYCQAILRDIPFTQFNKHPLVGECLKALNHLAYFKEDRRNGQALNLANAFRGFTEGDLVGPYISQFLLMGNNGLHRKGTNPEFAVSEGQINYGSITIDQRVRVAKEKNYMVDWKEYIDVQNGADFRNLEEYVTDERRFISTGRDLSTYVHYDALYEAYLNACLLLLGAGAPFDDGIPFQEDDTKDKQQGFAHYGPPHILTLVTEVATRALKAVRYQKFNVHRRLRPEALGARMHRFDAILSHLPDWTESAKLKKTFDDLEAAGIFDFFPKDNCLLPMAFCEGSPMHPSYGAGHATVAGACVTILKAFFKHDAYLNIAKKGTTFSVGDKATTKRAFVPSKSGYSLEVIPSVPLTVEGELNKLAANISIGRNWAGVHYYSDYTDSVLLGEEIAIGLLQEQALTYNPTENFSLTLPKFDGTIITID